jgi:hypothetical protein
MRPSPVLLIAFSTGLAACSSPSMARPADLAPGPDLMPVCTNGGETAPATFANVETIFAQNCGGACHYTGFTAPGGMGLDLTRGHAYGDIVNQVAPDPPNRCGGPIVTPGDPARSYLLVKLTVPLHMQCNPNGYQMPVTEPFFIPLPDCEIDLIRRWIAAGAPPD